MYPSPVARVELALSQRSLVVLSIASGKSSNSPLIIWAGGLRERWLLGFMWGRARSMVVLSRAATSAC